MEERLKKISQMEDAICAELRENDDINFAKKDEAEQKRLHQQYETCEYSIQKNG